MAYILCIETATETCSVAVLENDKVIALEENQEGNAHASQITLLIEAVMKKAGIELNRLDAVAVSKGPGSYTGLRVGVSTAKGLCYGLDIPLISVNTLASLANGFVRKTNNYKPKALFVPMLDARRMEVYCAVFDNQLNFVRETEAKIINETSFSELTDDSKVYFFGNGSSKCSAIIRHENAVFVSDQQCSAAYMAAQAFKNFTIGKFEDVAYFEPYYLKDFVGTKAK